MTTPTQKIKEIEKEIEELKKRIQYKFLNYGTSRNYVQKGLRKQLDEIDEKAKLSVYKEWEEEDKKTKDKYAKILIKIASKFGVRETLLALGEFKDIEIDKIFSLQEDLK